MQCGSFGWFLGWNNVYHINIVKHRDIYRNDTINVWHTSQHYDLTFRRFERPQCSVADVRRYNFFYTYFVNSIKVYNNVYLNIKWFQNISQVFTQFNKLLHQLKHYDEYYMNIILKNNILYNHAWSFYFIDRFCLNLFNGNTVPARNHTWFL